MSCCCNWNSASCDKACQMPSFHPPYKLKRKTIMMYIRLIFVSPCKVISTVVVHDCWFNSHKDVDPLCVFLMKSVSCGRAGLFSVCSLWLSLVCHCHHPLDILACCGIHAGMRRELGGPHSSDLQGPRLLLKVLISAALRKGWKWRNTDSATRFRWLQLSVIGASSITVWNQCKGWWIVDCVCSKLHFPCFVADSENRRQPQWTVKHETRKPQISPNLAVTARTGRPSTPCTGTPLTTHSQLAHSE